MPSKELHHLRRAVEAAQKLVKKPVLNFQQAEAEAAEQQRQQQRPDAPR